MGWEQERDNEKREIGGKRAIKNTKRRNDNWK